MKKKKDYVIPERFKKNLDWWLNNIQDWCISRQLLWGHKIPVWYKNDESKEIYVGLTPPADVENYTQETSVLDTWFSSGLWPLALTKYAKNNNELKKFYPIDLLVTGYDILFFWVARMYMQCGYIDNTSCIKKVYLHGLIRDSIGRKMSKSLGNGIDPMDIINEYGSDALRLYLLSSSTVGEDILFNKEKINYFWSFLNKIWNASNLISTPETNFNIKNMCDINKAILDDLNTCISNVKKNIENYNLVIASKYIIDFVWENFCNKYLEMRNSIINDSETNKVISYIFKSLLIILHPFAPFICEYLYKEKFGSDDYSSILNEQYPQIIKIKKYDKKMVNLMVNIFSIVKDYRIKYNISWKNVIPLTICNDKYNTENMKTFLNTLNIKLMPEIENTDKIVTLIDDVKIELINMHKTDINNEKKEILINKLKKEIERSENILSNKEFIKKASKEKIKDEQTKYEKYKKELEELSK